MIQIHAICLKWTTTNGRNYHIIHFIMWIAIYFSQNCRVTQCGSFNLGGIFWYYQFSLDNSIESIFMLNKTCRDRYGVRDAIIIWCAAIAMVTGWPIGYCLGSIMYHTRELVKSNYYWRLEYKKISVDDILLIYIGQSFPWSSGDKEVDRR